MRRWIIFSILIGIGAMMILSMIYVHERELEATQLREKIESLRNVRLLHSLSNQELIKLRYQLFSNYDKLSEYSKSLHHEIENMYAIYLPISGKKQSESNQKLTDLRVQLEMKLELQKQFKAANAKMKSSLLRVRDIANNIKQSYRNTSKQIEYFSRFNQESLQLEIANDKILTHTLQSLISNAKLSIKNTGHTGPNYNALIKHAKIALNKTNLARDLMSAILAIPIENSIEQIQSDYKAEFSKTQLDSRFSRRIMYTTSCLLLAFTLVAFARLTQRKKALAREKELAQITLKSIADGVISTDADGIIQFINPMGEQITQWSMEEAKGKALADVFRLFDGNRNTKIDSIIKRCITEKRQITSTEQSILINKNREQIDIEDSFAPIFDMEKNVAGTIVVFRDVSDKRALSKQLEFQAVHDALTGVINRHGFDQALATLIRSSKEDGELHALLYLDLDQFKVINDTCGHDAGDHLLMQFTNFLQQCLPLSATLARLGGDEFGILLSQCTVYQANEIADNLLQELKQFRFEWQGIVFQIAASIGVVSINRQIAGASFLLSAADMACYVAKDLGRNRVHVYNPNDKELTRRQDEMEWVAKLTTAIKEERFCLFCQKISDIKEPKSPPHYEVLLRLRDSDGKLIMPDEFIPAAERYNFMPTLDRWVIHHIFSRFRWFNSETHFSINLSGTSLNSDSLVDFIKDEIQRSSLSPGQVCFEVTETAAIANLKNAANLIQEIKSLGFRFALDDFGQGLSSYTYLNNLPVDFLKIDGEFVRNINQDPVSCEIVTSIQKIGHLLGMQTIAEYVEDEKILHTLKNIGIDHVQGFHFGQPEPLDKELDNEIDLERNTRKKAISPKNHPVVFESLSSQDLN